MNFEAKHPSVGVIHSLTRAAIGFLFLCHGAASLFGVMGGAAGTHGGTVPFGVWPSWWAAVIQLVCGALVMLGAGTRWAALIASGSMAYAYFTVHQAHGVFPIENNGEAAALYAWIFLMLVVIGPGPWTATRILGLKRRTPAA
ncbi:DoxX family protein [Arthrobacter bambusae]|uniref:Oxidoreductase n=1 Tax=Arthrobacter bambusae TaxID=1338426 RepID=A0AAW8DE60_9MICC|nr:DoxX family protein [Arthrobacter bambusae]MDP9904798.1 putative oxidoreductase [Arthrobacter bambusae]MDQ0129614.1 putative oxidoreductase [Arthrobacter bambusae]MDQ0180773.1 putative oxidoreductase [Arthrobacter bambusae]